MVLQGGTAADNRKDTTKNTRESAMKNECLLISLSIEVHPKMKGHYGGCAVLEYLCIVLTWSG